MIFGHWFAHLSLQKLPAHCWSFGSIAQAGICAPWLAGAAATASSTDLRSITGTRARCCDSHHGCARASTVWASHNTTEWGSVPQMSQPRSGASMQRQQTHGAEQLCCRLRAVITASSLLLGEMRAVPCEPGWDCEPGQTKESCLSVLLPARTVV